MLCRVPPTTIPVLLRAARASSDSLGCGNRSGVDRIGQAPGRPATLRTHLAATPIAAGAPIPVLEELQANGGNEMLEVDPRILGRWADHAPDLYALPVKGQSMIDALIADGDIVIMARQETA